MAAAEFGGQKSPETGWFYEDREEIAACGRCVTSARFLSFCCRRFAHPGRAELYERDRNKRPAEKVWQVVTDKAKYTEWQTNLARVEVIDDKHWIEYPKDSPEPLKFIQAKDERPRAMEFDYLMGNVMYGNWKGEVVPTQSGVRLKTIDRCMANGWLTKILLYLFFDFDKFAKDWNTKLKQRVEGLR